MTKKQEWFSLAQASLKLERGSTYVSVWLRRHPKNVFGYFDIRFDFS
ncbi:hypothetical protein IMAU40005_03026 [Lactiplantibacillus plantarum]|nr:hypothetical protein [Lactiplantibacillus plantarum]MCG0936383.1 hypothetical protein [Lactiplantibacillus plantarum]